MSPKYLCGESYGTTRAAALSRHLQEKYALYVNGLMLISSVLDWGSSHFGGFNDDAFVQYLPTYTAIAHYHGKLGDRPLREVLDESEEFAAQEYPWALQRGSRMTPEERSSAVAKLASLTGLTEDYVDRVNLRPEHIRFFTELLRDERRTVGRIDGRFKGWEADYGQEHMSVDPSIDAIMGPYSAALNHYVRSELGYQNDLSYEILTERVYPWSYKEFEGKHIFVADKLAEAMRTNPHMRVHVACGYYDGATPYYAAEHTFAHLEIPDELREQHRVHLPRVRPHDVPARAQPAGAVAAARRLRDTAAGLRSAGRTRCADGRDGYEKRTDRHPQPIFQDKPARTSNRPGPLPGCRTFAQVVA